LSPFIREVEAKAEEMVVLEHQQLLNLAAAKGIIWSRLTFERGVYSNIEEKLQVALSDRAKVRGRLKKLRRKREDVKRFREELRGQETALRNLICQSADGDQEEAEGEGESEDDREDGEEWEEGDDVLAS
jgi:hypothetical protein